MSDAFDVFDPFEPLEAAEEPVGDGSRSGEGAAERPVEEPPVGSSEPPRDSRPARRWTAPAGRPTPPPPTDPVRPSLQQVRPDTPARSDAPQRRLPTGADFEDALDAVLYGPRGAGAEPDPADGGSEDRGSEHGGQGAVALVPDIDLVALRTVALPELEAAVERLSARGHVATLSDDLAQREGALVVRFRPDQGPLAALGSTAREPARFELRLAADLDDETHVVASQAPGAPDAPLTRVARTPLSAVQGAWVAQRFVDFVRQVLGLG